MQTNDDDMTHATVKQSKRKVNTKDFQTKPIPEKKRKKEVDANEIIKTHTKKGVEDHEEETQQKTTQIYQRKLTEKLMQHEVREIWNAMKIHQILFLTNLKK